MVILNMGEFRVDEILEKEYKTNKNVASDHQGLAMKKKQDKIEKMRENGITMGYTCASVRGCKSGCTIARENQNQWEGGKWQARAGHAKVLPGGLIPMCCWPSITKPPMG